MCGFTGYLSFAAQANANEVLEKMGNAIAHRGPDDSGVWFDADAGIGLSHRRLSILDLSPAGHQPMVSSSGQYVIAFNGEIYNHLEIRKKLADFTPQWRGHSDTETLLASFDAWGIEATVKKSIGMFAFAVWDRQTRALTLCRDRLGEKPLYYGWQGDTFLFGSELKTLKVHPSFHAEIDRNALALLMRHNCISTPYSIYQDIAKLQPGCLLTVSLNRREPHMMPYWSGKQVVEDGLTHPFTGNPNEAVDALERLLKDAVAQQMIADVPLGAFLSGGVDSSTIVALMQAQSVRPVKTFTIGFHEEYYNEAEHAKAIARHLGTEHSELYVTPQQTIDVIFRLPTLYDEPFSDSSQIPTFLVSQMTRQHVTVSLSGDAGDELFGGYNNYLLEQRWWDKLSRLPVSLRVILSRMITGVSPQIWNRLLAPIQSRLPIGLAQANIGDKLHKGADVMIASTSTELYQLLISHWMRPFDLVIGGVESPTVLTNPILQPQTDHFVHQMMALDMLTYLPDDILVKVDRAAMGVSLETRVPLLDHRVVEFAWSLPLNYKLRNGVGKWVLRQVLYKYVPKKLIERPKMGFGVPIDTWLRGPLRNWAEELLSESRLRQEGYFNPLPIRQKWNEHLSGNRNWQHHLWDVLMFQAWLEAQKI
ncbi:MAG: asparagine synthase (glutamine-hydrolyzing) [Candidatus Omnitrophica bacterium]|nr:asparagine synthase (glutamine-hydrolyzing) [Candidatus Omnitrophota bacterium]